MRVDLEDPSSFYGTGGFYDTNVRTLWYVLELFKFTLNKKETHKSSVYSLKSFKMIHLYPITLIKFLTMYFYIWISPNLVVPLTLKVLYRFTSINN